MDRKKGSGGHRIGSGRKKKEPTKIMSFRVKKSKYADLKKLVKDFLHDKI